jgi:hypothetical protein
MAESNVMEIHGKSPSELRNPRNAHFARQYALRRLKFFSIVLGLERSRPQAARITIAFCFDRRGGFDGPRRRPIAINLNH